MTRIIQLIFAIATLAACTDGALAQPAFPNKPLLFISPFAPGPGPDIYLRPLVAKLAENLGQTVVLDNKVGFGGSLAAQQVVRSAPDGVLFPYITLLLSRTSLAAYNGYRETAQLEVQAIGRPESQLPLVESAMDLVDQCLTAYTNPSSGLIVGRSRTRNTVPMFSDPADSTVVAVLATYELYLWPTVLTSRM